MNKKKKLLCFMTDHVNINLLSVLFVVVISCNQPEQQKNMGYGPNYSEGFIQNTEIRLHYLDWGGTGQPLILIHGLGDSPYLFDDLASSLKTHFRVIAYSRRGHCKSVATVPVYDNIALVSDIKLLLDSLKIDSANLLGWSMGGNEITEFAIRYPERANKLIYLEAGYDLSDEAFRKILTTIPKNPFPDSLDLKSLDAYRKWYHRFWFADIDWNSTLEANLKATTKISPNGTVSTIPSDSITTKVLESAMSYRRDYKNIQSPALAIFTKRFFVPPDKDDNIVSAYANMEKNIIDPWRLSNINQMKAEFRNVTIKEVSPGSHVSLIFLSKDSLVASINSFLLNL
jgi:pimeloyl-ACP methyl ester carboxylesterase